MTLRRAPVVLVVVLMVVATACSSSSKSSGSSAATTTSPKGGSGSCPFSGSTTRQTTPGGATATALASIAAKRAGCIDQVTFFFAPGQPASSGQYQSETGTVLVLNFARTTLAAGVSAGAVATKGLEYVQSMNVATAGSGVTVTITLDRERPFLMSATTGLDQVQLAIG